MMLYHKIIKKIYKLPPKDIEAIQEIGGPMTMGHAKKGKEALNQMMTTLTEACSHLEGLKTKLVNYI